VSATLPLAGRRIVTTRDRPGELDRLLAGAGAELIHVPLIEIVDVEGVDAQPLNTAIDELEQFDWLVVTSRHGAARLGVAAAGVPSLRLAAVGTSTASELAMLAGRRVDLVPERQTAADLVAAFPAPAIGATNTILVAQADRAQPTLVSGLRERGYRVTAVVAYRTRLRRPSAEQRAAALNADCVAFTSGSAAISWSEAIGPQLPACAVAIGPTTAAVAVKNGLQITHVAADHSIAGLVATISAALSPRS